MSHCIHIERPKEPRQDDAGVDRSRVFCRRGIGMERSSTPGTSHEPETPGKTPDRIGRRRGNPAAILRRTRSASSCTGPKGTTVTSGLARCSPIVNPCWSRATSRR